MYEEQVAELLHNEGIEFVVSLPCDRTKDLCMILEDEFRYVTISREEDGVGICSGISLMNARSVLQMQSSGLGNSLNALMTLPALYGLPLPILASWRGYYQEKIAAQIPFNEKIPELLTLYDIAYTLILTPADIPKIQDVIKDAYNNRGIHVALISPRVWEGSVPEKRCEFKSRERETNLTYSGLFKKPEMKRADAIRTIASLLNDEYVISNIGVPSKELHAAMDRKRNFYMLGSYTQASPIGLGVALATKDKVVVLDGDGSLLGTAILPVVSETKPDNLTIVCLDNGVYGSTGDQCSPAYQTIDLELIARASGFTHTQKVHTADELTSAWNHQTQGPRFIHVIIEPGNSSAPNISYTPHEIRNRFSAG
ncbi:sulfopyruvate decarboxylase subunit beta [Methanospirillum lacunae]|uniref:sulfopyruvate decarboxylase n=1 Tax=Methanospirillum lacunae TaxID=668570 RepID=A0A2V2N3L3_9EURY|nr:sulfopyruvate decarboxylase subunit beta [Methanospirillum lacunae]PWR74379.1 thiamine pyrophosphate-binding protein [Methanospirillum lacunae]